MPLTEDDLKAMRLLFEQVFDEKIEPVNERLSNMTTLLEGIVSDNEKREQEYLVINGQLSRIEKRIEAIESREDNLESRVDDVEKRVENLELHQP